MLGGIAFQLGEHTICPMLSPVVSDGSVRLAAITIYVALAAEFVLRFLADRPVREVARPSGGPRTLDTKTKLMLFALSFSSLTIFIRYVSVPFPPSHDQDDQHSYSPKVCISNHRIGRRLERTDYFYASVFQYVASLAHGI